jgi:hypothetical protein
MLDRSVCDYLVNRLLYIHEIFGLSFVSVLKELFRKSKGETAIFSEELQLRCCITF